MMKIMGFLLNSYMLSFDKYYNSLILESYDEKVKELLTKIINANTVEEAEELIATHDRYSYRYARDVLHGRFELGEKAISRHFYYSCWYAIDALGGRFELGEPAIEKDYNYSQYYIDHLKSKNIPIPEIFK